MSRQIGKSRVDGYWPYLFVLPFFLLFAAFGLFPLLFSLYLSFHSWDPAAGFAAMTWVGFENYSFALLRDDWLHASLYNTLWIAFVSGIPQHLIAMPLAYFLFRVFGKWRNAIVGMYFLPFITSTVAIALVFGALLSTDFGVINQTLAAMRDWPLVGALMPEKNIDWLNRPEYVKWTIAFVVFWRYVGWNTVLYLSALQAVPKDLLEAAEVDGAGPWKRFMYVVVPLLRPMMFFAITLTIIGNLQLFEEPFILTSGTGGIDQAGKTAAMHMYWVAFREGDFGTASAIAWLLFAAIALMTWLNGRLLGERK